MPEDFTPQPPPPSARNYAAPPPPYAPGYPPPYPPVGYGLTPPRRRSAWFYIGIIGGSFAAVCLLVTLMVWVTMRSVTGSAGLGLNPSQIAVIDISGVILSPEGINTELRKFGDNSSVKAIILHINSPGGGAAASQEVYNEVLRIRKEKHKKIVASVESVGASGAYYIASACDKIYANNASVVGSIGVIMEWTNYGELLRWAKLKNITITKGELKSAGDPSRDLTPKEQAYFQSLVDNMYTQFVHDVATGRHTTEENPLSSGRLKTSGGCWPSSPTMQTTCSRTRASCSTMLRGSTSCGSRLRQQNFCFMERFRQKMDGVSFFLGFTTIGPGSCQQERTIRRTNNLSYLNSRR